MFDKNVYLYNFLTVIRENYIHIEVAHCCLHFSAIFRFKGTYGTNVPLSSVFLPGSNAVFTLAVNLLSLVKVRAANGEKMCCGNRPSR